MAYYFFDIHDGFDLDDNLGRELFDCDPVELVADEVVADYIEQTKKFGDAGEIIVIVRDVYDTRVLIKRLMFYVDSKSSSSICTRAAGPWD